MLPHLLLVLVLVESLVEELEGMVITGESLIEGVITGELLEGVVITEESLVEGVITGRVARGSGDHWRVAS